MGLGGDVLPFQRGRVTAEDYSYLTGQRYKIPNPTYPGMWNTLVLVKNVATIVLAAKKAARWKTTSTVIQTEIDGYSTVSGEDVAGVVDDKLSGTWAVNAYGYIVTEGPCLCITPAVAASMGAAVALNDKVMAATAAASTQTTDAGSIQSRDSQAGTTGTTLAYNITNAIGRAMSARTSANTAADILVMVGD